MQKRTQKQIKKIAVIALLMCAALVAQVATNARILHPDRVIVWVFDVGQGDAIFIDSKDAQILIDGGKGDAVLEKLGYVLPFWDRSIDIVINTHPHADHVEGLNKVLDRYRVEEVWISGQTYETKAYEQFEQKAGVQSELRYIQSGEKIQFSNGAEFEVLFPFSSLRNERLKDPNAGSIVALFEYGEGTMLFTGDIGVAEEKLLEETLQQIDVLKVGHQGSKTSSAESFLKTIQANAAIISVGKNSYGHPHPTVLDRLEEWVQVTLRTDHDGDVRIIFDGGEPKIATIDL